MTASHSKSRPARQSLLIVLTLFAFTACTSSAGGDLSDQDLASEPALLGLTHPEASFQLGALTRLEREWDERMAPAVVEYITLARSSVLQQEALQVLRRQTGQNYGYDINAWFAWIWKQQYDAPEHYADFKSRLYSRIDRRFAEYFDDERVTTIRLDEVRWGGVLQDGIPPLRGPEMIAADEADYLDDDHVVFGIEVNGDVRAYPKRILAWHEMFVDEVGGVPVVGVYCTLCGSMILYDATVDGVEHAMGTSGFLYRSNKLMYDQATSSLWNTMWGTPVVGPLVDQAIRLPRRSVVTSTWGEWRRRHPDTTVLSLDTGHRRDYGEGVAYQEYFATDELMFNTALVDQRLANKAEVLGLVFADGEPLAISARHAAEEPLLHETVGERELVVVTDRSGAMRAYETRGRRFVAWDQDRGLVDADGVEWTLSEDRLTSDAGQRLARLPSHSAFWFGWYGAYPNTRLLD
ncbi:MAG: DUF3179 domain-containing protein [Pseudomonadota bacterium]